MATGDPQRSKDQAVIRLRSARCQFAYWDNGDLRIVNYLTRGTFAANPIVLEIVRFFSGPRTIRDAMLEFDAYTPESVGEAILKLIDAGTAARMRLCPSRLAMSCSTSSWKAWLPAGGYHFLTKDAPYVGGDWTFEQKCSRFPARRRRHYSKGQKGPNRFHCRPMKGRRTVFSRRCTPGERGENSRKRRIAREHFEAAANDLGRARVRRVEVLRAPCRSRRVRPAAHDTPSKRI